ncbi:hypothetical protein ACQUFY_26495 (plasmid) [Robbsia andropogonis]|uniref:hypothetical protein n=1 Tax=Robbsia andropogonis TaxID=28092 RepID=UPI003D20DBBD
MNDTDVLVRNVEPVYAINPEISTSDAEQVARVETLLVDDTEAALVAREWVSGKYGNEAAEALQMNKNQFEAARKRLVRKLKQMDDERRNG